MDQTLIVLGLTTMAGAAMPVGALIARFENIHPEWLQREFRHSVIAFGGGVLLAAVALVLVPHGVEDQTVPGTIVAMILGGLSFMGLDILLARLQSSAAQLLAMLADFIPEAMAMGAGFAVGDSVGLILALLIALQNLPEGFNAYRELASHSDFQPQRMLWMFVALVPLGPIAGMIGYYWLAPHPGLVAFIMLFAAGGILYLTFQDLAPQAKLERHWFPPMAAVLGFLLGLIGNVLIG